MIMSHRKLIVHMQIANQASLIHRPTSFTPKAHRSSLETIGSFCMYLSLSLNGERRSHLITVTCGWMRDIVIATSSSKPFITEQVFIFIYLKKKGGRGEERARERIFYLSHDLESLFCSLMKTFMFLIPELSVLQMKKKLNRWISC